MLMMNMYFLLLFFYLLRVEYQVRLIFSDVREKKKKSEKTSLIIQNIAVGLKK